MYRFQYLYSHIFGYLFSFCILSTFVTVAVTTYLCCLILDFCHQISSLNITVKFMSSQKLHSCVFQCILRTNSLPSVASTWKSVLPCTQTKLGHQSHSFLRFMTVLKIIVTEVYVMILISDPLNSVIFLGNLTPSAYYVIKNYLKILIVKCILCVLSTIA